MGDPGTKGEACLPGEKGGPGQPGWRGERGLAGKIPYSSFFRSVKFSFCAKKYGFSSLVCAHVYHTPTHARWSCGKIFVLSSKRTNFRTDEKKPLYGTDLLTAVCITHP